MNPILAGLVAFLVSFGLPILVGASRKSYGQEWYRVLKKPPHAAGDLAINIVFLVIYLLETFALYHILTMAFTGTMIAFTIWFLATAVLSGIWSRLFFQYRRCDWALYSLIAELVLLWSLIAVLHSNAIVAWYFLLPRALWGFYAVTVNVQLLRLNYNFWNSQKLGWFYSDKKEQIEAIFVLYPVMDFVLVCIWDLFLRKWFSG